MDRIRKIEYQGPSSSQRRFETVADVKLEFDRSEFCVIPGDFLFDGYGA